MSSDIRLEDDRVTVEGKLDVDDGASNRQVGKMLSKYLQLPGIQRMASV